MIVDPSEVEVFPGTAITTSHYGLLGAQFEDPVTSGRIWSVDRVYGPVSGRALGGIRAKVVDAQGIRSFVNQRDLELVLNMANAGGYCSWTGKEYPYINDPESGWFGVCCDATDMLHDLHADELYLRAQHPEGAVLSAFDMWRYVHYDEGRDVAELWNFLHDRDHVTGRSPDPLFETIERRWVLASTENIECAHT